MDWIKRNLYFLVGSLVALALMGLAGGYLYSRWQLNNEILGGLDEQYAKLKRLYEQKPHPGSGQVDNIKLAKEQRQALLGYIRKSRQVFQRCPPIPESESGKLTSQDFSSALSRTIDQLQRDAAAASVVLPPKDSGGQSYSFSFAAQREKLEYARGSVKPLSVQLGEVKAICDVLFAAKVNSLERLRRERVSDDDAKGPQTDYLSDRSVTNDLAVLSPYEVGFRCFSSELAAVLGGFASSPCGMVVKTINVQPATLAAAGSELPFAAPAIGTIPPPYMVPSQPRPSGGTSARDAMMARFMGRRFPGAQPPPQYVQPAPPPPGKGGLPVVLDEKKLDVTLMLNVVKLAPAK